MSEALFKSTFKAPPELTAFSPGRVNLIGEHTDYNGGFVLPTALWLGLEIAIARRHDNKIKIVSDGFDEIAEINLDAKVQSHWSDYARGAVIYAGRNGLLNGGADIAVSSNLPQGAGLSSSASITVGILKLASALSNETLGADLDDVKISQIARQVENEFIGMPCGIMDQMAVAIAQPGQALFLDTDKLTYDIIELPDTHHMAVIHSGKYRRLNEGRYKERKEECDVVKTKLGRDDICRISVDDLNRLSGLSDVYQRRALHCMREHQRTIQAAKALQGKDFSLFGQLMIESHTSMRDDFEISLPAIDNLVADAVTFGANGARMTGGGFGGCIVACVEKSKLEPWKDKLLAKHGEAFYVC